MRVNNEVTTASRLRANGNFLFASALLVVTGIWQFFVGFTVVRGESYLFEGGDYWYRAENTTWGWTNILIALAFILLGYLLFKGSLFARICTTLVVMVSAINQFFLAPQYPIWSTLIIVANIVVLWAVVTAPSNLRPVPDRGRHSE